MWKPNWEGAFAGISAGNPLYGLQTKRRTALTLRIRPIVLRVLTIGWLVWGFDALTKRLAQHFLEGKAPKRILGNFLQLTFQENSGAAFSLYRQGSIFFGVFAVIAIGVIAYWTPRITSSRWAAVFGLVLGGTLGNLTDRIFRGGGFLQGHVIDWIELPHWPVFNGADSAIVAAAGIAIVLSMRSIAPITRNETDRDETGRQKGEGKEDA